MFSIPAEPGVFLITLDPDDGFVPIVGWFWGADGHVKPMVFGRTADLVTGEAVQFPSGIVVDPATRTTYDSAESWRDCIETDEPYSAGIAVYQKAPTPRPEKAPEVVKTVAPKPVGSTLLRGKEYAKASFWKIEEDQRTVVLNLTPGHPCPVGVNVQKITRDEFYELRKTLTVVSTESLMSKDDEPELPLGDDDDDGNDLI